MTERIAALCNAVMAMYGVTATHVESNPIRASDHGKVVWEGVVEKFKIDGHPRAKHCYAWSVSADSGTPGLVTAVELPPVKSPLAAVKAAIAAEREI